MTGEERSARWQLRKPFGKAKHHSLAALTFMGSRIPTKGPAAFQYDLMLLAAEENSDQAVLLSAEADEEKTPQRIAQSWEFRATSSHTLPR